MKRGEIWWASLPDPMGRRPVLVVQSNAFNSSGLRSAVVVLITSNLNLEGAPGNVRVPQGEAGLSKASVVNVSQVHTLERTRFVQRLGTLPAALLRRVDGGLRLVLELPAGAGRGAMEPAAEYAVRKRRGSRDATIAR
jgi:mRNA interferase MazF